MPSQGSFFLEDFSNGPSPTKMKAGKSSALKGGIVAKEIVVTWVIGINSVNISLEITLTLL